MDKFLLAENPLRPEQSGLWIVHMLDPKAIIRCTQGNIPADDIRRHYSFKNTDGVIEEWTLSAYHFFTTDFLTEPEAQAGKLLDRAWRWFRAYMEAEDNIIDSDEKTNEN